MGVGRRLWGQGLLGRWRRTKSKNVFIVAFFIFLGGVFVRIAEIEIGFRCGVNITARGCWTSRMRGRWPSGHLERRESEWGEGKESVCDRADQQWPIEHNSGTPSSGPAPHLRPLFLPPPISPPASGSGQATASPSPFHLSMWL
jgi:hypothetical protein